MAVDLLDGALGIEARHSWVDVDTVATLITLGDLTVDPHYKIRDIAGLFDFPEIEDNSEPKTEDVGLITYPSRARGKNVTYTVEVRASTLQLLRRGAQNLRTAFGPDVDTGLNSTRQMKITPHPDYGLPEHAYIARCLQFTQGSDVQSRGPNAVPTEFTRSVVIGLRLYDPRIYEVDAGAPFGVANPKW